MPSGIVAGCKDRFHPSERAIDRNRKLTKGVIKTLTKKLAKDLAKMVKKNHARKAEPLFGRRFNTRLPDLRTKPAGDREDIIKVKKGDKLAKEHRKCHKDAGMYVREHDKVGGDLVIAKRKTTKHDSAYNPKPCKEVAKDLAEKGAKNLNRKNTKDPDKKLAKDLAKSPPRPSPGSSPRTSLRWSPRPSPGSTPRTSPRGLVQEGYDEQGTGQGTLWARDRARDAAGARQGDERDSDQDANDPGSRLRRAPKVITAVTISTVSEIAGLYTRRLCRHDGRDETNPG